MKPNYEELENKIKLLQNQADWFKKIADFANDWIIVVNEEGIISYISPSCENISGYKPDEFFKNPDLLKSIVIDDDKELFFNHQKSAIQESVPEDNLKIRIKSKEGQIKWIEHNCKAIFDSKGKRIGHRSSNRDITSQMLLEFELIKKEEIERKSKENLMSFFNTVGDLLFVLDNQGFIVETNDTVIQRLGYTKEELAGMNVIMLHPEDQRQEAAQIVMEMLEGKKTFCPIPVKTKSGDYIAVETRVSKGIWNNKEMLFGLSKDITEIKFSQEKFNKIFESSPLAIALTDISNSQLVEVNEAFAKTIGLDKDQIRGKSSKDLNLFKNQEDRNKAIEELKSKGVLRNFEAEIFTIAGETRFGIFSGDVIRVQDKKFLLTMMNDITEDKLAKKKLIESEQRWQFALEGSGDGVWDWNLETNEVFFTKQWKAMLGYEEHEISNNLSEWDTRVHPDDKEACYADINRYLEGKAPVYSNIHRVKCKNGEFKWILDRGKIVEWHNSGKPLRMIGTHTDLTRQKNIENQLRELNTTKDKLFSILAHDLRNPFNTILGFSKLIMDQAEKEDFSKVKKFSEYINSSANQTLNLLNNLLEWANAQTNKISFEPQVLTVEEIIKPIILLLNNSALQKEIMINSIIEPNLVISADKNMIETVVRNLVSNAIKYTPNKGNISINAFKNETGIELSFIDTGVGIKKEDIDKLFRSDIHFTTCGTNGERGTGIGLLLCKDFVEKHKGKIFVESEVKKEPK